MVYRVALLAGSLGPPTWVGDPIRRVFSEDHELLVYMYINPVLHLERALWGPTGKLAVGVKREKEKVFLGFCLLL